MKYKRARKRKTLEIAIYVLIFTAISFQMRAQIYSADMIVYTVTAGVFLLAATLLILLKSVDEL